MSYRAILAAVTIFAVSAAANGQTLSKYEIHALNYGAHEGTTVHPGWYAYNALVVDRVASALWLCEVNIQVINGPYNAIKKACIKFPLSRSNFPNLANAAMAETPTNLQNDPIHNTPGNYAWLIDQETGIPTLCLQNYECFTLTRPGP